MDISRRCHVGRWAGYRVGFLRAGLLAAVSAGTAVHAQDVAKDPAATFRQYCVQCHGAKTPMGGVSLEQLVSRAGVSSSSVGEDFQQWERVITAIEQRRMPPKNLPQPQEAERGHAVAWIRGKLKEYAEKHAGDPGRVTVRRLTSGEYAYTISDLTGVELKIDQGSASDSVGGEGFTNFGDVQFMQDANLERYLESAKRISDHAVIGAGPLEFFIDPGKSGFELSAISRIQEIYRANGFRAASGEGGKPYGLDRYSKAFYACWRYQHRVALGQPKVTLAALATREGISTRFVEHIWSVVHQPTPTYPASEIVARWRKLPAPTRAGGEKAAREASNELQQYLLEWPRWLFAAGSLAAGGEGDERSLVLSETSLPAATKTHIKFASRDRKSPKLTVHLQVLSVNPGGKDKPLVFWRNPMVRFLHTDRSLSKPQPLMSILDAETAKRFGFGINPAGGEIAPTDFVMSGDTSLDFEVAKPTGAAGLELQVEAEMGPERSGDSVVRCTVSESEDFGKGRPAWALLAYPQSAGFKTWKTGVLKFAEQLPQTSHGEPTPSDKDPIPLPYNTAYNQPERDAFHTKVKYYRDDRFLVEKMLDDASRQRLDQAWSDLLSSFEYHDEILHFIVDKYHLDLKKKDISELTPIEIEAIPAEPRQYVKALREGYDAVMRAEEAARPGHLEDCLRFAAQAWRRPLTEAEKDRLRALYTGLRERSKLDHSKAIRTVLARTLVAPAFLYRLEQPATTSEPKALSGWELAGRLSYFLWSSVPDQELRRAAAAGELSDTRQLERQVRRMLADDKTRRFSTEFFGQWLGFYHFDQYTGVDTGRFPEFTDEVKSAMYDEAVSFFEHIIRKDRPMREILFADYTFLNGALAKHYGVKKPLADAANTQLVPGAAEFQRGGLLRLGAVLTATSAPLRTSPVKRGDWVLRRILGTPTPPPPADAGSIPADDKAFGGLSVRERLAAHQQKAACASCHSRIDPLGFPLENYDAVGRWRDQYSDGKPIEDSAAPASGQTQIAGVEGLVQYLRNHEDQVFRTMSKKLIGYALGRTIIASDLPLVDRLATGAGDASFSKLAVEIVTSKQFRYRREQPDGVTAPPTQSAQSQPKNGSGSRLVNESRLRNATQRASRPATQVQVRNVVQATKEGGQ